jgi:hypothetical protein
MSPLQGFRWYTVFVTQAFGSLLQTFDLGYQIAARQAAEA